MKKRVLSICFCLIFMGCMETKDSSRKEMPVKDNAVMENEDITAFEEKKDKENLNEVTDNQSEAVQKANATILKAMTNQISKAFDIAQISGCDFLKSKLSGQKLENGWKLNGSDNSKNKDEIICNDETIYRARGIGEKCKNCSIEIKNSDLNNYIIIAKGFKKGVFICNDGMCSCYAKETVIKSDQNGKMIINKVELKEGEKGCLLAQ